MLSYVYGSNAVGGEMCLWESEVKDPSEITF